MNRSLLNLIIDLLASVFLLAMIATGYLLRFPLPPTTNRTHELWGMSRHEWGTIHSWASAGLLAVLCVHLVLHWEWIFAAIRRRFSSTNAGPNQRFRTGIITMAVLLMVGGLFAVATHMGVRRLDRPLHALRLPEEAAALPLDRAPVPQTVDFHRDVMPIFEAFCIGCHGPRMQRASFRVDRREDFFAPRNTAPLIVPGNPPTSLLMAIVSGEVKVIKSAEAHLLPPREIAVLNAWINAGADWPGTQPSKQSIKKP